MQQQIVDFRAPTSRSSVFWASLAVVTALALVLLGAIYTLCRDQVRQADMRQAGMQQLQTAFSDCLQHTPDATIGGCKKQVARMLTDGRHPGTGGVVLADYPAAPVMNVGMPVSFAVR